MFTTLVRKSTLLSLLSAAIALTLPVFQPYVALAGGGVSPIVAASASAKTHAPTKRGRDLGVSPNAMVSNGAVSVESIAYIGYDTGSGCRRIYGRVTGQAYNASSWDVAYLEAGGALMYGSYGSNYQAIQDTGNIPNTTWADTGWQGDNQAYCGGTWYQAGHSYFNISNWESYVNEDASYSF